MAKVIDGWTIGGSAGHPSMPGPQLQTMIGSRIRVDMFNHVLIVPSAHGLVIAERGDYIALYDDGSLEVRMNGIDGEVKEGGTF